MKVVREVTEKSLIEAREYVLCEYREEDLKNQKVQIVQFSVEHGSCKPLKDVVRGTAYFRVCVIESLNQMSSRLTWAGSVIPGGSVAKSVCDE